MILYFKFNLKFKFLTFVQRKSSDENCETDCFYSLPERKALKKLENKSIYRYVKPFLTE